MEAVCANVSGDKFLLILSLVSPFSVVVVSVHDGLSEVYYGVIESVMSREKPTGRVRLPVASKLGELGHDLVSRRGFVFSRLLERHQC